MNLEQYRFGAKTMTNFIPHIQGPVSNRSGFKYIAETKTSSKTSRLIPFEFSTEQAYVLEFGESYIRYYMNGGQIQTVPSTTVLLLSSNGTNADTTFTDDSPITPHTVTANGNAQLDTADKKFGSASGRFDGTGDYLTIPDDADFDLSASDGGFDAWVKPVVGSSNNYTVFRQDIDADSEIYMQAYLDKYTGLLLNGNGTDESTIITDSSLNTKTITRDGNTSLLLHGTGSDGSSNIIDSSSNEYSIVRNGTVSGPIIDTNTYKFGGSSIIFDESDSQYLVTPDNADFNLNGVDFTISAWINLDTLDTGDSGQFIWCYNDSAGAGVAQRFDGHISQAAGKFVVTVSDNSGNTQTVTSSTSITANNWHHLEFASDGTNYYMFIDGALDKNPLITASIPTFPDYEVQIGRYEQDISGGGTTANYLSGWLDDFAILKGAISHTDSFSVPTSANAAVEIDTSDPKFGTGAIKFGGQDHLIVTGSSDTDFNDDVFTISGWFNYDAQPGEGVEQYIYHQYVDVDNFISILITTNTKQPQMEIILQNGGNSDVNAKQIFSGWNHFVVTCDGGSNYGIFINGSRSPVFSLSSSFPDMSATDIYLGTDKDGANGFVGLLDDIKIMKSERYDVSTSTLTVPSAEDKYIAHPVFEIGDTVPTVDTVKYHDDTITADAFHHVEINYDVSEPQVYMFVDGQLHSGGVQAMTLTASGSLDSVFSIGADPDGSTLPYEGWMDEIRFVNGALSHTANFVPNTVEYLTLGTTPYETITTYTEAELAQLQYVQSADTLYIVHPNHFPAQLTRTGHVSWTLTSSPIVNAPISWAVASYPSSVVFFEDRLWYSYSQTLFSSQAGDYTNFVPNDAGSVETQAAGSWTIATDLVTVASNNTTWIDGYKIQLTTSDTLPSGLALATDYYVYRSDSTHIGFATTAVNAYAGTLIDFTDQGVGNHTITLQDTCTGDACAMQYTIASNNVNEIQWLSSGKILVAGTTGGEYKISASSQDEALTPTNVRVVKQSSYGSAYILPLTIKDVVLYLQRLGRKVREFTYRFEDDTYVSPDLTVLAEHITESSIKYMDYQQEPNSIVWAVKNNGDLIGMTYSRESGTVAWHKHTTNGNFESLAVIPSITGNDYEELWVIVKRTKNSSIVRYIEQLQPQFDHNDSIEDAFFVDSGLSYEGVLTTSICGLDHLEAETVVVLAGGVVQASKTVSSGCVTIDTAARKASIGLSYSSTLQTMRYAGNGPKGTLAGQEKRIPKVVIRLENAKQFQYGHSALGTLKTKTLSSLTTGDIELTMPLGINREGYVAIVNTQPLPITITAIIPEVNFN